MAKIALNADHHLSGDLDLAICGRVSDVCVSRRVCKGLGADITVGEMALCTSILKGNKTVISPDRVRPDGACAILIQLGIVGMNYPSCVLATYMIRLRSTVPGVGFAEAAPV